MHSTEAEIASYLDLAEQALRRFGGAEITRDTAALLLPLWGGRFGLTVNDETELLARFPEPVVPHLDLVGETDPQRIKAFTARVDADEQGRRDQLVHRRFTPQPDLNAYTGDVA